MSLLDRIEALNRVDPREFRPFLVGGARVGWVRHEFAERLAAPGPVFDVCADSVALAAEHWAFEARSAQLDAVVRDLVQAGVLPRVHGERYPVTASTRDRALCTIDRGAAPFFGVRAFGQHVNGYVRKGGDTWMWVARRSRLKWSYPGRLDQIVAGGVPYDLTLSENLVKECAEEAGMAPEMAMQACPVGTVSYCHATAQGLKPDVIYCYDLELPPDFVPEPRDGEVESFELWPLHEVHAAIRDDDRFKPNCALVIIDFLIRHGVIEPSEPDYPALVEGIHRPARLAPPV